MRQLVLRGNATPAVSCRTGTTARSQVTALGAEPVALATVSWRDARRSACPPARAPPPPAITAPATTDVGEPARAALIAPLHPHHRLHLRPRRRGHAQRI